MKTYKEFKEETKILGEVELSEMKLSIIDVNNTTDTDTSVESLIKQGAKVKLGKGRQEKLTAELLSSQKFNGTAQLYVGGKHLGILVDNDKMKTSLFGKTVVITNK